MSRLTSRLTSMLSCMRSSLPLAAASLLALAVAGAGCGDDSAAPGVDAAVIDAAVVDAGAHDVAAPDGASADAAAPDLRPADSTSPDTSAAEIAAFVGDWLVTAGEAKATMCTGLPGDLPAQPLTGKMVTVKAGTDAALELTLAGCTFKLDVSGNVATARPAQSCMTMLTVATVAFQVTLTFDSSTFTVSGDSGTLVQTGHASANSPVVVTCVYTANATGMKVAPGDGGPAADALPADAAAADAAPPDTAAADAAPADAAPRDAAPPDADLGDAAVPEPDAAPLDAAPPDTGS
jgi:hypothetical protein